MVRRGDGVRWPHRGVVRHSGSAPARWLVDGLLAYEARDINVPASVCVGFGLFTLHQQQDGRSVSLHGQGMSGQWRNLRVPA